LKERLFDIYQRSPEEALDHVLSEAKLKFWSESESLWCSSLGVDGRTRYGLYKLVDRTTLIGRLYDIEFFDGTVGIFFTDVLFDPKLRKHVSK
jgi:hypothetical protein